MPNLKILYLVENSQDYEDVQDILGSLSPAPDIITTSRIKKFRELAAATKPNVAIIEAVMGNKPLGLNLLNWVSDNFPNLGCIMISSHKEFIHKCLEWGARSFILKEDLAQLSQAVSAVGMGQHFIPTLTGKILSEQIFRKSRLSSLTDNWRQFSKQEKRIIYCQKQGLSRDEISELLGISTSALEKETESLKKKTQLNSLPEIAREYEELVADI